MLASPADGRSQTGQVLGLLDGSQLSSAALVNAAASRPQKSSRSACASGC
jgi:hypothetical protein